MIALEALHQLPLHEKLFVMETLWEDLSKEGVGIDVPQWHRELLDVRESQVTSGSAKFIDWELAKEEIRAAVK